MGAGGGFPGLVLAVQRPDLEITLVDASRKKSSFLQHVIRKNHLTNAKALHIRVEDLLQEEKNPFDIITCRAFSSISEIVRFSLSLLDQNGTIWAMRGIVEESERKKIYQEYPNIHMTEISYQLAVANADRTLVEITI